MKHTLYSEIDIIAPKELIWKHLVDFPSYEEWNPFIHSIQGTAKLNSRLKIVIGKMKFTPTILELLEHKKLTWLGSLWTRGIFDGKHTFEIVENEKSCTFIQREEFKGILVRFFRMNLNSETLTGFHSMNKELKRLCENKKRPSV
jgi:hypothetical protein